MAVYRHHISLHSTLRHGTHAGNLSTLAHFAGWQPREKSLDTTTPLPVPWQLLGRLFDSSYIGHLRPAGPGFRSPLAFEGPYPRTQIFFFRTERLPSSTFGDTFFFVWHTTDFDKLNSFCSNVEYTLCFRLCTTTPGTDTGYEPLSGLSQAATGG